MYTIKVKTVASAQDISDEVITGLTAEMGQARGLEAGDFVRIVDAATRMVAMAVGRSASPDALVYIDFMAARTKEGRRFTWTCQVDVEPATRTVDTPGDWHEPAEIARAF